MAGVYYGVPFPGVVQHPAVRHRFFRKCNTYLAMIACVLQETPGKMLTFTQLMEKLEGFVGDRKCFENNIRVCLSSSKCFIKVPMYPSVPSCRLNYWKLDHSQITAKMVRRHFKKILCQFPEFAHKIASSPPTRSSPGPVTTVAHSPDPANRSAPPTRRGAKFRGPFSIESLLRRDSASIRGSRPSPPPPPLPRPPHQSSCLTVQVERVPVAPEGRGDGTKGWLRWDPLPAERVLPGPANKRWPSYALWSNDEHRDGELGAGPFRRMSTEPSAARIQQRCGPALYAEPQVNLASRVAGDFRHFRL